MKKNFLVLICSAVCAVSFAIGLCACADNSDSSDDNGGKIYDGAFTVQAAYEQANELGYTGTLDDFIMLISGKDGKDGVGISTVFLDSGGELIVVLTDGTVQKLGKINGQDGVDGKDGRGISSAEINAEGELVITYTDGTTQNLGKVVGSDGKDGQDGENGNDGPACVHTFSKWTAGLNATCTSIGYNIRTCTKCGANDYEFTEAHGHSWNGGTVVKDADCTKEGLTLYTCSICNTVKGESIPEKGHSFDESGVCSVCGEQSEIFDYMLNESGDGYSVKLKAVCRPYVENLAVPSEYNGLPVTELSLNAIINCEKLKRITLPDTIIKIGIAAFSGNSRLEYVNIPKSVREICERAFFSCKKVNVVVDEQNPVFKITNNCLIDTVNKVLICGFENCSLPDDNSYNTIGEFAFWGVNSVSVIIPDFVTDISYAAFCACNNLTSVIFGDGVLRVGKAAFYPCLALQTVVINKNILSIGEMCFANTKIIYFEGTEEEWNNVEIGDGTWLNKATLYFYSETQPETQGNFWHYVNGIITVYGEPDFGEEIGFTLYNNNTEYRVTMRNRDFAGVVTIPSTYNGLPVTEISRIGLLRL